MNLRNLLERHPESRTRIENRSRRAPVLHCPVTIPRLCIPLCAARLDELASDIKRAAPFADLIELRLDCLALDEFALLDDHTRLTHLLAGCPRPTILTLRATEQGGHTPRAADERSRFWQQLFRTAAAPHLGLVDIELDLLEGVNHQGIVALIAAARYADADELLATLAAKNSSMKPPLVVVLDGVEDPRNLGAIIRTVECAGAHGVFVPERRAAGLTDVVAKTAAGALEYVPIARTRNTVELLEQMKTQGIWTIGTAADAEMDYTAWDWRTPSALVVGGEGAGLRRLVRERCDALVRIPLLGRIESLNVSVAAAIVLYEAVRQRKGSVE